MGFFQGTQERVRNSRGKRAISVRATEVVLYIHKMSKLLVYGTEISKKLESKHWVLTVCKFNFSHFWQLTDLLSFPNIAETYEKIAFLTPHEIQGKKTFERVKILIFSSFFLKSWA